MKDEGSTRNDRFSYRLDNRGVVHISSGGRIVKTLRGNAAVKFIERVEATDEDGAHLLMAKATGQFKFGNERHTKRKGV